jgi:prenylcysteine oxidase/farnesylcysteine lyase
MALWDGQPEFRWLMSEGNGWYDWYLKVKLGWRFGFRTHDQVKAIVQDAMTKFERVYDMPPWTSTHELLGRMELTHLVDVTLYDYLIQQGINEVYVDELVNGITRVNYGMDVRKIHALAGLIGLAPLVSGKVYAVKMGNQDLVKRMIHAAEILGGVEFHAKEPVTRIQSVLEHDDKQQCASLMVQHHAFHRTTNCQPTKRYVVHTTKGQQTFDGVVLATPMSQTNLTLPDDVPRPWRVEYRPLHVTLLKGEPNPELYGLDATTSPMDIPGTILTHGSNDPLYLSHTSVLITDDTFAVDMFSNNALTTQELERIFRTYDEKSIVRVKWHAYPWMSPAQWQEEKTHSNVLSSGLWYVNAIEPAFSAMETAAISGNNIVQLVLKHVHAKHS